MKFKEIKEKFMLYLKYRSIIWGIVWLVVGILGGNADRIVKYVPTLQYGTPQIEQKIQEYQKLKKELEKTKKELDKLRS